jgi:hypothetical protein
MVNVIDSLFTEFGVHPVLMEIGATGEPPAIWGDVARHSTYVGIGPDSKPSREGCLDIFKTAHLVEKIATVTGGEHIPVNIIRDPVYTSVLKPHPRAIADFIDPDMELESESLLPAVTIDTVVASLSLPGIDWLRTNINGVDVPVFQSIGEDVRRRILVVDTCLDFVELFEGQSSSVARFPEFISEGFWLSRAQSYGPIRMRRESLTRINSLDASIGPRLLSGHHRRTPGWLFSRFLRTAESLAEREASQRDYLVLWAFALLDGQLGFAADLALDYQRRFGADKLFRAMDGEILTRLRGLRSHTSFWRIAKRCLPAPLRRSLRRMLQSG